MEGKTVTKGVWAGLTFDVHTRLRVGRDEEEKKHNGEGGKKEM